MNVTYSEPTDTQAPEDSDIAELHDRTLWAFLSAADDLSNFGYTSEQLTRKIQTHLALRAVQFGPGEVDPFKG